MLDGQISNDSGSSLDSGAIIGGVVGGVILLLMITVVLCIVLLCMRRCHRKADKNVSYTKTNKLNEDVTIHPNPSYGVAIANTVDSLYNTIKPRDSDVPITSNSSYNVPTKPYSEDEYNYVQPNEYNPSYRLTTGEDRATAFSTTSGTKAGHSSHDANSEEYDYAYAQDDDHLGLLHHSTAPNTTGDTRSPYLTLVSNGAKGHNESAAK